MQTNRLQELRKDRGLKRHELAVEVGVDPSTIYRWETGKTPISDEQKRALCRILDISIVALMGWEEEVAA